MIIFYHQLICWLFFLDEVMFKMSENSEKWSLYLPRAQGNILEKQRILLKAGSCD